MKLKLALIAFVLAACARGNAPSFKTADDKSFELKQLNGQVVLLDFFATWCEPCKSALPAAQRVSQKLSVKGFRAYAVNVEKNADAAGFLKGLNVELPLLRDTDGVQAEAMGAINLPFSVLIDRKGVVRWKHEGFTDESEAQLAAEADKLLAEQP
jgi:thiol-disulfide isomerase/thioredoxin